MLLYMLRWPLRWHPLTWTICSMMSLGFEDRLYTSRNTRNGLGTGWMHMVVVVASCKKALIDTGCHFSPSLAQMGLENVTPLLTL